VAASVVGVLPRDWHRHVSVASARGWHVGSGDCLKKVQLKKAMTRRWPFAFRPTVNIVADVVHTKEVAMASVDKVVGAAHVTEGLSEAGRPFQCGVAIEKIRAEEYGLLTIQIKVQVASSLHFKNGESILIDGEVNGGRQVCVWIQQVRR
jgi:hypothetical protein